MFGTVPSLLIVPQLKLVTSCFRIYNQFFINLPTSKGVLSLLVNFTDYYNILKIATCIWVIPYQLSKNLHLTPSELDKTWCVHSVS